jgi:D-amino peptidase
MRVYLSADIEGITSIAHWDEADRGHPDYPTFRNRMEAEVAAAVEGALAGGASEVVVKDAHASARNLRAHRLPASTLLIRGWSGHPYAMVQELDDSFSALLAVGFHSPGTSGGHPLAHTMTGRFNRVSVNGVHQSELRLCRTTAATHGVPLVFVSGDGALCETATVDDPAIRVVATHRGVGNSVLARHPETVEAEIRSRVCAAVESASHHGVPEPLGPFELEIRFRRPLDAYRASHYPGAKLAADDTVVLEAERWMEVLTALAFW